MSVFPSLNTLLSFLSFLTVVFALVRVGAAAFSANQDQDQDSHQHRQEYRLGISSRDEKRLVRPPVYSHGNGQEQGQGQGERRPSSWQLAKAALPAAHLLQLQLTGGGGGGGPGDTPSGASAGNGYGYGYTLPIPIPMSLIRFGPPSSNANSNSGASDFSFAQALRSSFGFGSPPSSALQNEKNEKSEEMQYVGGHDLVRMPAMTWTGVRRPGLLFRPPSPYPETDPNQPLSMAKLIMSRHQNPRRPNRPTVVRRPPGLSPAPSARSRLVEEV